jgi:hypothetical protein
MKLAVAITMNGLVSTLRRLAHDRANEVETRRAGRNDERVACN